MKKYFYSCLLFFAMAVAITPDAFAGIFISESLKPADYDVVQTISFDSIYSRSGIFKFPDNTDSYRKIIMLYKLKCDVNTLRDQYNCGEWDYDTYTFIRSHTGIYDSTLISQPLYMLGQTYPKTINYSVLPKYDKLRTALTDVVIDNTIAEREHQMPVGTKEIALAQSACKFQFVVTADELSQMGMITGDSINGIKLYFKDGGFALKNLTIKMLKNTNTILSSMLSLNRELPLYRNDATIQAGWNKFRFPKAFVLDSNKNFTVEISYDTATTNAPILMGIDGSASFYATTLGNYYKFDGKTDFVNCGKFPEFNNAQALTIEAWIKIDKWQNWGTIANFDDRVGLQLSDVEGEIYCMARNNDNNVCYGSSSALSTGAWVHVAMAYDGTQATPNNRMKLFINGKQVGLTYRKNDFSWKIPPNLQYVLPEFIIGGTTKYNSMFKGGISEVRVWKKALTRKTISDWMSKPITGEHPDYANLAAWYDLTADAGITLKDKSSGARDGKMFGLPELVSLKSSDICMNTSSVAVKPSFGTFQGEYTSHLVTNNRDVEVLQKPYLLAKYLVSEKTPHITESTMVWAKPYTYTIDDLTGLAVDSVATTLNRTEQNDSITYYSVPVERVVRHEIARFITPYGISGLPQVDDGFLWAYDVTDYAPLLKGNVDISAHNYQELADVKFIFIKGTPPRPIISLNQMWGGLVNYSFKKLADNSELAPLEMPLAEGATQFKMKTRITGHGHQSSNGDAPWCCEWHDNTHYLTVDGTKAAEWHVYTNEECRSNPVFPQGGTWPAEREGWCPGDLVRDRNFNITSFISNRNPLIDYAISPVPTNNLGMGNGDFKLSFYLVQYGPSSHSTDAEIYNVITPNNEEYYSRVNPICSEPKVEIRNNGTSNLTTLKFSYSVSGGAVETYNWTGNLAPNETITVTLPVSGSEFWIGNDEKLFTVNISEPNGQQDEYADNNTFSTRFKLPDLIQKGMIFMYKTNSYPQLYTYEIKDMEGNVVMERSGLTANRVYYDTLNYDAGCYTFSISEPEYGYGLSYWAVPGLGDGFVNIIEPGTKRVIKAFEPNFGIRCVYSFYLDKYTRVEEPSLNNLMSLYPVPAVDFINVSVSADFGHSTVELFDMRGDKVYSSQADIASGIAIKVPTESLSNGVYFIKISNGKETISNQFVRKK